MSAQTTIAKLRAKVDALEVENATIKAALVKGAPAKTIKDAITEALDLPAEQRPHDNLGVAALATSIATQKNREVTAEVIFGGDNAVTKSSNVAKARAAKKNAAPRRGSPAWRKEVIARADARAKSGKTILRGDK